MDSLPWRPWTGRCQRCCKKSFGSIMSMFNHDLICGDCKRDERKRPNYKKAEARDLVEYAGRLDQLGMKASADAVRKQAKDLVGS